MSGAELPPIISRCAQRSDAEVAFEDIRQPRFYMRREYLDRFGLTPGCRGCLALMQSERATNHSEVCRSRIEAELAKCGDNDQTKFEQSEAKRVKRETVQVPETSRGSKIPPAVPAAPVADEDMTLADHHKRVR